MPAGFGQCAAKQRQQRFSMRLPGWAGQRLNMLRFQQITLGTTRPETETAAIGRCFQTEQLDHAYGGVARSMIMVMIVILFIGELAEQDHGLRNNCLLAAHSVQMFVGLGLHVDIFFGQIQIGRNVGDHGRHMRR